MYKGAYSTTVQDDYMTPPIAWEYIRQYIPVDKTIWEPFYGDGRSGEILREMGFDVIHNDEDFFTVNRGEVVVSNPPFSCKKQVIQRLVELDKPFILLMPSNVLVTRYLKQLTDGHLQIIIPPRRIHFKRLRDGVASDEKSQCSFDTLFFCWKMNLPSSIIML